MSWHLSVWLMPITAKNLGNFPRLERWSRLLQLKAQEAQLSHLSTAFLQEPWQTILARTLLPLIPLIVPLQLQYNMPQTSPNPCSKSSPSCILAWTCPRGGPPKPQHKPFSCFFLTTFLAMQARSRRVALESAAEGDLQDSLPRVQVLQKEASDSKKNHRSLVFVFFSASGVLQISQSSRSRTRLKTRRCSPSRAGFGLTSRSGTAQSLPSSPKS